MKLTKIDNAREFEWSKTTDDYSTYRTEYPQSLFNILTASGVGLPGQRILDLGTGTGALAIGLARQGAEVTGLEHFSKSDFSCQEASATAVSSNQIRRRCSGGYDF